MEVSVQIPFQASITLKENKIEVVGSKKLLEKVQQIFKTYGLEFQNWKKISPAQVNEDILINEFIRKLQNETFVYNHEELCHCRMVKTETVCQSIMSGSRDVSEVSRTTLAGTGCGSCRKDIEVIIEKLTK